MRFYLKNKNAPYKGSDTFIILLQMEKLRHGEAMDMPKITALGVKQTNWLAFLFETGFHCAVLIDLKLTV